MIPDTLSVTSATQTLSKVEGDTLQLICEVTRQTSQHTHVAVGWYVRSTDEPSGQARDLVTLTRDMVLRPGTSYRQRLSSGDVRLDKTSSTSYRLTIYSLQPTDEGQYYCEASEWIQDPDRSWYSMTRKQSDKTVVKVQPTGECHGERICLIGYFTQFSNLLNPQVGILQFLLISQLIRKFVFFLTGSMMLI